MKVAPHELWPWLALAGLGVFHGVNPAMGWLFAVALGLHRQSRKIVALSWVPIAAGHTASLAAVLVAVFALGLVLDHASLTRAAAGILLGWAIWHAARGHRQRLRIGMQTGLAGLALWSFLMSSAHGAGLMLVPVLLPMCSSGSASEAMLITAAAVVVHTAAMLATVTTVSLIVYDWLGLALLRAGWINFDLIWTGSLMACGILLLLA